MPRLKRELRRQVQTDLCALEDLNFSLETPESVQHRIEQLPAFLDEAGASPQSSYYDRLQELTDRLDEHSRAPSQTTFTGKREYVGMSAGARMKIKVLGDNVILMRQYSKSFKVSWSFNQEGKIEFVESLSYQANQGDRLITVTDFKNLPRDWKCAQAEYEPIPQYALQINRGFYGQPPKQQYSSLLRFGHGDARNLMKNLERADIKNAIELNHGQRQLIEIVDDSSALRVVANAGAVIPTISDFEDNFFSIRYEENNRN